MCCALLVVCVAAGRPARRALSNPSIPPFLAPPSNTYSSPPPPTHTHGSHRARRIACTSLLVSTPCSFWPARSSASSSSKERGAPALFCFVLFCFVSFVVGGGGRVCCVCCACDVWRPRVHFVSSALCSADQPHPPSPPHTHSCYTAALTKQPAQPTPPNNRPHQRRFRKRLGHEAVAAADARRYEVGDAARLPEGLVAH